MNTINFYHYNDPNAPPNRKRWGFVYLHGAAEACMDELQTINGWEWDAPDLFYSDAPKPTEPGVYLAMLYGTPVVVVLAAMEGVHCDVLEGRVAINDPMCEGFAHCFDREAWR